MEMVQHCLLVPVTVTLLLQAVSVFGKRKSLSATSEAKTTTFYMYELLSRNENSTIVITADNDTALVECRVKTSQPLNQTQCDRGGNKVYSDGRPDTGHYLGTFCGGRRVEMFVASHNSMVIVLDNAVEDDTTITIIYKTDIDCNSGVTAGRTPRYIRSPGYPNGGIPNRFGSCGWMVEAPDDERVQISLKFATSHHRSSCTRSSVTITDGASLPWFKRRIGIWCGGPQSSYISWENMMAVVAKGLEHITSGIELEIIAVPGEKCEHKINADDITSGEITSPGYPNGYADLLECRWEISVSQRRHIRITVLDSDMDSSPDCLRDNVKIYTTGQALDAAVRTWCGTQKPFYESNTFLVLLVFKAGSGYNNSHRGFKIRYEQSVCGGNLTAVQTPQQLSTVGYPSPFQGFQKCFWYIRASNPLNVVKLSVIKSDLQWVFDCYQEKVNVYDGLNATYDKHLGTWCGSNRPSYRSKSSSMTVVFSSDSSNTNREGFIANYVEDMCGYHKETSSDPSWIVSPGYPANYVSGYNCFWNLTASGGTDIGVRFTDLDISCPEDGITIYDGGVSSDHRSWEVCGNETVSYLSTTNTIFINFHTQTNQGKGFKLSYKQYYQVTACDSNYRTLNADMNRWEVHSPGYPDNYFDNLSCGWLFTSLSKVRIEIKVKGLPGQDGTSCGGDYISVYDGEDETAPVLYNKLCRDDTVESSGRHMFVKFLTDGGNTGPGFTMYYQGFGVIVSEMDDEAKKSWIILGVVLGAGFIAIIMLGVLGYVLCQWTMRRSSTAFRRRQRYISNDDHQYIPSSPLCTDDQQSHPTAPPPSYCDIDQFPPDGSNNDEPSPPPPSLPSSPPPPSYTDALQWGITQNN